MRVAVWEQSNLAIPAIGTSHTEILPIPEAAAPEPLSFRSQAVKKRKAHRVTIDVIDLIQEAGRAREAEAQRALLQVK